MHFRRLRFLKYWAMPLLLVMMGCGSPEGSPETSGTTQSGPAFVPVDFQQQANRSLAEYEGLPTGAQNFQGVEYRIGSQLLQLGSLVFPDFPSAIQGIPIGETCQAIHFLHATQGGGYQQPGHPKHEADGVEVGQYIIHYADGGQAVQPIVYGEHLRGWWDWDNNLQATKSNMVWTGDNPNAGRYQRKIRLYWTVWENPHPEKTVEAIDFVSANAKAAPFCLAMTLESAPNSLEAPARDFHEFPRRRFE